MLEHIKSSNEAKEATNALRLLYRASDDWLEDSAMNLASFFPRPGLEMITWSPNRNSNLEFEDPISLH